MQKFQQENLEHIQGIFSQKTGVHFPEQKKRQMGLQKAVILAAALLCFLMVTGFAVAKFSSLKGDEVRLRGTYEGKGIVSVWVENESDRNISFQPDLRLMRYKTGMEIPRKGDGQVTFQHTDIAAHSQGTMTIDLSDAYDLSQLEEPLENDWYELILTNNGFAFGQDWKCSIDFSGMSVAVEVMEYPKPEADLQGEVVEESLTFYFQKSAQEKYQQTALEEAYQQAYENLPKFQKGQVVSSVSPVLPGNRIQREICLTVQDPPKGVIWDEMIPSEKQYELMGLNWSTYDSFGRFIGAKGEYAMVLSVLVPLKDYADGARELPLFYVMVYDREETQKDDACAFIHGQTVLFEDLEERKVFEDEKYVAYDVSGYVNGDWEGYLQAYFRQNPDVIQNEQTQRRIQNFYTYYEEYLSESVLYLQDTQKMRK